MISTSVLLSVILILWIYFLWSRRQYYIVAWKLPGPIGLPFLGVGLNMTNPEKFLSYLTTITNNYSSPCISWMGSKCFLYAADPETIETVFNSPNCTNKGDFYRFMAASIGDGLFTSSSPRWNKHRKLINPAFSRQIINNFLPIFDSAANILLEKFQTCGDQKQDIYDLLKKCVLQTACQTTMGKKMEIQNDKSSEAVFKSYKNIMDVSVQRMLSPWLYPDVFYKVSSLYTTERNTVKILYDFIEGLLHFKKPSTESETVLKSELESDNLSRKSKSIFVEQVRNYVEQGQLTWEDIRDEANVIIAATFETTSTALYFVTLCLAIHPEYQEKLFEELVSIFPEKQFEITKEDLEQMTYTEMVINEGMRLFSPVPVVIRTASDDFYLKNGVKIPKGTQVGIDIFNMQRNSKFWGPKAMEYDPDHFSEENMSIRHPFAFVPFTKGLRMCIGNRYALLLMKVLIAKIFRNFEIRADAKIEDLIIKGTISLKLRHYPECTIQERVL
ncbi:probable cytochrome P450 313b1 [Episyrphus balteatus]|uniref:probable cytochrome P450 313b1 n=1 Tax=Episyrphus balteatus TaxID=286459 RepID=UPI0024864A7B|nr:probable cytochrome P450 313b1 [Episyrphus balteatus]